MEQYSPLALANNFIKKYGKEERANLTHMKIQKLVFYSYGWWLTGHNEPLLTEGPEVWKYGPVFSELYDVFRFEGKTPLEKPFSANPFEEPPCIEGNSEVDKFIEWIWQRYGHLSAFQLSDLTHAPGTPWQKEAERNNYCLLPHHKIPDSLIKEFFQNGGN